MVNANKPRIMWSLAVLTSIFGAGLAMSGFALAAKPAGGGGDEAPPSGTIYFGWGSDGAVMNADGSNKLRLPVGVAGDPSRLTYGASQQRWFLQSRMAAGEKYPDGRTRSETFAMREDGDEAATVQLTDDPGLQLSELKWSPGDQLVSAVGRRWTQAGEVDPGSVGLYVASVLFDGDGNALGLDGALHFATSFGVQLDSNGDWTSESTGYDWSPDLLQIVYGHDSTDSLYILDLLNGESRLLIAGASPLWSPDGSRIAFYWFSTADEVATIGPDGKNRKTLVKATAKYGVGPSAWSPSGGHLLYQWHSKEYSSPSHQNSDIYRITATGGSKTNLTSDISEAAGAIGWR